MYLRGPDIRRLGVADEFQPGMDDGGGGWADLRGWVQDPELAEIKTSLDETVGSDAGKGRGKGWQWTPLPRSRMNSADELFQNA